MSKYDPNGQNIDDLLRQVDSLLDETDDDWSDEEESEEKIDLDEYAPFDDREDDPVSYQNYSNDYGRQVRNYNNGYAAAQREPEPVRSQPTIPAYNADFHQSRRERNTNSQAYKAQQRMSREPVGKQEYREPVQKNQYRDYGDEPDVADYVGKPQKQPKPKAPKSHRRGCGCMPMLIAMIVAVVALSLWLFQPPRSDASIGERKSDTATILICGADIGAGRDDSDGSRTDTMMLLYLSGSERKVSLMSLPRDTYTVTSRGVGAKLNSAYGRNGTGEEGMEGLMDYVQEIIGYRPDGYILVDMTLVTELVDLMGGLKVNVPVAIEEYNTSLQEGLQDLNGEEVLTLLRHRKSYAMADLTRVEVQRSVIEACMEQWLSLSNLKDVPQALNLVENNSISSLGTRNYLWIGKTLLLSLGNGLTTETLPGYADYIDGVSYYILNRDEVAQMINDSFNPYKVTISPDELKIAG